MRILVIGEYLNEGMAGTKRIRALLDPLIKSNKIEVLNLVYYFINFPGIINPAIKSSHGISYSYIGIKGKTLLSIFKISFSATKQLLSFRKDEKKMILYIYGFPDMITISIILVAKLFGYKIIFDIIENNWFFNYKTNPFNKIKLKSSLFFMRFIKFYANGCIAISTSLETLVRKITKNKTPTIHIPISIDTDFFRASENKSHNGIIKIFWGGSIIFSDNWSSGKDGLFELLEAFDNCCQKNTFLYITGSGPNENIEKLKEVISTCQHRENIFFLGFLTSLEYCNTLLDCDIAVMNRVNSKYANDGFPYKLGEFLSTGKAVIATDVGDVSMYLENEVNSIVIPPSNRNALIDAFNSLFAEPDKIRVLGRNGRIVAENFFSSKNNSNKFYEFLVKITK